MRANEIQFIKSPGAITGTFFILIPGFLNTQPAIDSNYIALKAGLKYPFVCRRSLYLRSRVE